MRVFLALVDILAEATNASLVKALFLFGFIFVFWFNRGKYGVGNVIYG
jgi:hypothetical protein